jgi:hypothetical protein
MYHRVVYRRSINVSGKISASIFRAKYFCFEYVGRKNKVQIML